MLSGDVELQFRIAGHLCRYALQGHADHQMAVSSAIAGRSPRLGQRRAEGQRVLGPGQDRGHVLVDHQDHDHLVGEGLRVHRLQEHVLAGEEPFAHLHDSGRRGCATRVLGISMRRSGQPGASAVSARRDGAVDARGSHPGDSLQGAVADGDPRQSQIQKVVPVIEGGQQRPGFKDAGLQRLTRGEVELSLLRQERG